MSDQQNAWIVLQYLTLVWRERRRSTSSVVSVSNSEPSRPGYPKVRKVGISFCKRCLAAVIATDDKSRLVLKHQLHVGQKREVSDCDLVDVHVRPYQSTDMLQLRDVVTFDTEQIFCGER